jgi:hypothetical protein
MAYVQSPVSDMLVTVKSREVQRGMMAEMGGRPDEGRQHFLAAAHLELVLARDYEQAGDAELARRSRVSAASCFWRAGETPTAQAMFEELKQAYPERSGELQDIVEELPKQSPQ